MDRNLPYHATEASDDTRSYSVDACDMEIESASMHQDVNDNQQPVVIDFGGNTHIDDSAKFSLQLHALLTRRGLSRDAFDEVVKMLNGYMQQHAPNAPPLMSTYLNQKLSSNSYPVKSVDFDACRNGCKLYGPGDDTTECTLCDKNGVPRWIDGQPVQQVTYLSISEQLALLLYDPEVREILEFPRATDGNEADEEDCMEDVFDGAIVRDIVKSYDDPECKPLMLGMFTDGFEVFKKGHSSLTMVNIVVLNLPRSIRTESKFMLQPCIIPGPFQPKDLFSFLKPVMDELATLDNRGIRVLCQEGASLFARAHLLFVGGDIPAQSKVSGHALHTHEYGCRLCVYAAKYLKHRYTYPPVSRDEPLANGKRKPLRARYRTITDFATGDKDHGLQQPTPFAKLPFFSGVFFSN